MVAFMHTGTRLTAGYRYTTLGDATAYVHHATVTSVSYGAHNVAISSVLARQVINPRQQTLINLR